MVRAVGEHSLTTHFLSMKISSCGQCQNIFFDHKNYKVNFCIFKLQIDDQK